MEEKLQEDAAVETGVAGVSQPAVESEKNNGGAQPLELIDGTHKYTDVFSLPYRGIGGAHHSYIVRKKPAEGEIEGEELLALNFQDGAIGEVGINGVMDENFIAIVIDRLNGFQSGPFRSEYNQRALESLQAALAALQERTKSREARGVEGTHEV